MQGNKDFDPEAFRKFEHDGWNRLNKGYHRHWEHLTTQAVAPMLDETGVRRGMRVLDVASGPGYMAAGAASRGADVLGIDLAENMVELARRNHPGLEFRVGDAENLPFREAEFDAVLINFGVLHFPDADRALEEAHRVLKAGGRLGFTAWADVGDSAILIAMRAVAEHGSLEVDLPAGTPIFRFADHGECARTLSGLGFADIRCSDSILTWSLPAADVLIDVFREATARTSGLLSAQDPAVLPAIRASAAAACRPYDKGDRTELPMPMVMTVTTKA